uniref:Magnesium transporter n=1 Tax=Octactis speculum TaxID=3111310 RepID=A0A7S2AHC4_9STRA
MHLSSAAPRVLLTVRNNPSTRFSLLRRDRRGWVSFSRSREFLRNADPETRANQQHLLFHMLDVLLRDNMFIDNTLTSWLDHIETGLHIQLRSKYSDHLYHILECAKTYKAFMLSMDEALRPTRRLQSRDKPISKKPSILNHHKGYALVSSMGSCLANLEALISTSTSLKEVYKTIQADRMNKVLYNLTLVTVAMIPAQMLTGIYGMNFDNIPELHLPYGYTLWWAALFLSVGSVFYCFHRMTIDEVGV